MDDYNFLLADGVYCPSRCSLQLLPTISILIIRSLSIIIECKFEPVLSVINIESPEISSKDDLSPYMRLSLLKCASFQYYMNIVFPITPGRYTDVCTFPGHASTMRGVLIVE